MRRLYEHPEMFTERTDLGNQKVFLSRIHLCIYIIRSSEPFFVVLVIRLACMMSTFGVVYLHPEPHCWFVFPLLNDYNN